MRLCRQAKMRHHLSVFTCKKPSTFAFTSTAPARLTEKTFIETQNQHSDKINAFSNQDKYWILKVLKVIFHHMSFDAS